MAVLIVGGILSGIFTPTEASVVAVVYGFLVSAFVYRELKWHMLPRIFFSSTVLTGTVMFIITGSSVLTYAMTINLIPQTLAESIPATTDNWIVFLLIIQIAFFLVGMFMDGLPAILVAMPILMPIAISYGIEPIHFGILVEANIALGLATPPVGICLFAACAVTQTPIEKVVRPLLPFIAVLFTTLLLITYVPDLAMYFPRALGLDK
jgi:C4-dicarboxylate transporter DctM subunit